MDTPLAQEPPPPRSGSVRNLAYVGGFALDIGSNAPEIRDLALKTLAFPSFAFLLGVFVAPAEAQEIFGGIYAHDVKTGITKSGIEDGVDFQLGWRGERIRALGAIGSPSPHAFVSVNSAGDTNFAAAGVSWKIGRSFYARPGVGLAIHDAPDRFRSDRIFFGSRVLFELEFGLGAQLNERMSLEASWVHLSHAKLLGEENPGVDNIGLRLNYRFR